MNRIIVTTLITGTLVLWSVEAGAWGSANRFGGSTSHSYGSTSHENRWGGSSSHEAGEGTEHTKAYGGSSAHAAGGGSEHTNMYGGSTSGEVGAGATHTYASGATAYRPPGGAVYPYHPPVAVPYYSSGCYGCAAAAGAVVGATVGAAAASANTTAAYSSGYAAGSAAAAPAGGYAIGVNYASLPPGSMSVNRGGTTYYLNGNTWFKPIYGANGLYYQAVPAP